MGYPYPNFCLCAFWGPYFQGFGMGGVCFWGEGGTHRNTMKPSWPKTKLLSPKYGGGSPRTHRTLSGSYSASDEYFADSSSPCTKIFEARRAKGKDTL